NSCQRGGQDHTGQTKGQWNLHDGVALLFDDNAAHIALVDQFLYLREQLLTHYLQLFIWLFLIDVCVGVCLCHTCSPSVIPLVVSLPVTHGVTSRLSMNHITFHTFDGSR